MAFRAMLMPQQHEALRAHNMVKRLTVTIDDDLYEKLEEIAKEQERTVPNLLAYLGREEIKRREEEKGRQK
jgi:predicted transcriptional regulator